jgi:hypothetical protein
MQETYTQWAAKHVYHVSNEPYPKDKNGNCTCDCEYCKERGEHKATLEAHLKNQPAVRKSRFHQHLSQ